MRAIVNPDMIAANAFNGETNHYKIPDVAKKILEIHTTKPRHKRQSIQNAVVPNGMSVHCGQIMLE
jgi:thiamine kinase-like enzyme